MSGGAVVDLFKVASELRPKAHISERIADIMVRLFIACAALASGLIAMAGACALLGWGLSVIKQSISLSK